MAGRSKLAAPGQSVLGLVKVDLTWVEADSVDGTDGTSEGGFFDRMGSGWEQDSDFGMGT